MMGIGASRRHAAWLMVAVLGPLAGGCSEQAPTGQVLATVAGEDVTRRDVAIELQEAPVSGADARAQALDNVIDRDLLVRVAKRRRLDVSPEYLGSLRRARAMLLTAQLEDVLGAELKEPSAAQIAAYIASYPMTFANREHVRVDQVVVRARDGDRERLEGISTMEGAVQLVAGRGMQRSAATLDTAVIPDDLARRLVGSDIGKPIVLSEPGQTRILAVTDRAPATITGDQAMKVAREVMKRRQLDMTLSRLLEEERRRTEIRYQTGMGPASR